MLTAHYKRLCSLNSDLLSCKPIMCADIHLGSFMFLSWDLTSTLLLTQESHVLCFHSWNWQSTLLVYKYGKIADPSQFLTERLLVFSLECPFRGPLSLLKNDLFKKIWSVWLSVQMSNAYNFQSGTVIYMYITSSTGSPITAPALGAKSVSLPVSRK